MARKGGPALYELLGNAKSAQASGAAPRVVGGRPPFDAARAQWMAWLVVCVVAAVIAYLVGVSRGERLGRAALVVERDEEMRLLAEGRPAPGEPAERSQPRTPPSANPPETTPPAKDRAPASENRAKVDGNGISRGQALDDAPLSPLQRGVDPRQAGLNYFVIATVAEPSSVAIAQFCRDKGLDAYVVPSNNSRFSEVVVLPGFPFSERSSAAVKGLEDRIRRVGVLYKSAARGNPDFGDMYHKLFKP